VANVHDDSFAKKTIYVDNIGAQPLRIINGSRTNVFFFTLMFFIDIFLNFKYH